MLAYDFNFYKIADINFLKKSHSNYFFNIDIEIYLTNYIQQQQ